MKNRVLLLAIPALLVLSGCNNASTSGMSKAAKVFLDDCFAHEESFGEAGELIRFNRGVKRAAPIVNDVGVQMGDNGTKMRFVATVDNPDSIVSATWTRNIVNKSTGEEVRPQSTKSPTGYYTVINDGGEPVNAPSGKGFVVYTITNIPADSMSEISVYLTLENVDGTTYSNTYVVDANSGGEVGTYGHNESSFTLGKFMGGSQEQDAVTQGDNPENNFASFTISLNKNEGFRIFGHDGVNHKYVVVSSSNLTGDASNYLFSNSNGYIRPNYNADYVLYLNKNYELYSSFSNIVRPMYVKDETTFWASDNAVTWIYAFGDGENNNHWYTTKNENGYYVTNENFDRDTYHTVIIVRGNPSAQTPNWDDKRNQTGNISVPSRSDTRDCVEIKGTSDSEWEYYFKTR